MYPKTKIILIAVMMLASVAFTSSLAGATATGSVSYSPTVFSAGTQTLVDASGGTFATSSVVYFYIGTTTASTSIFGGYISSFTLPTGTSTLNNAHVTFSIPSSLQGTYYIFASDSSSPTTSGAQFTSPTAVTVTSIIKPSISVVGTQPTTTGTVTGSGWDPSSTLSLYLSGQQGSPLFNTFLASFTTTTSGGIPSGETFTVPEVAAGTYSVVAEETSSSSPNYGITADAQMTIGPILTTSPEDISGAANSQFTLTGYGFPSLATITADGITVGSEKAVNSATTASSSGTFSVSVTLPTALTTTGPAPITVDYNTTSYTQQNAIYISVPNPVSLGFVFTPSTVDSNVYPGASYTAYLYNFPASSPVSITFGAFIIGQGTTDSNGFISITGYIPIVPAGSYYAVASSSGYYISKSVTVSSYFAVYDPAGTPMVSASEYFPSGGHYSVHALGLTPGTTYTLSDTAAVSGSSITSVSSGTLVSSTLFELSPASNGTLIFTFASFYTSGTTTSSITLKYSTGSVPGYAGNSYGYTAVPKPSFSYNVPQIVEAGSTQTLTVSGIIPAGSLVYPGLETSYNLYLGGNELSFTVGSSTISTQVLSSTTSSASVKFTLPSVSYGVYNLSITYSGAPVSGAIYSSPVVVSYPASSLDSGTVQAVPIYSSSGISGYYIVGYSFYSLATVTMYYFTNSLSGAPSSNSETLTYGAFASTAIATLPAEPSGTYGIVVKATYSSSTYMAYSNYTVYPSFSASVGGSYTATMGTEVSFTLNHFLADTYYSIYFGKDIVFTGETDGTGSLTGNFYIPEVSPGTYEISVYQTSSFAKVASEQFNVTASTTLSLPGGNYAFPGQMVNYAWEPGTSNIPHTPTPPGGSSPYYGNIYVTVFLNGSAYYTTVASVTTSGYINGSFPMPNGQPGNYWNLTLSWQQNTYTTEASTSSAPSTTVVSSETYTMPGSQGVLLGLVSGNGAMITGISSSQIADIIASVNSTITAAFKVPLSELNATISSINSSMAYIKTSFGTMEASLSSLNASITAVNGSVVKLHTSLGQITTSLSSINATLVSVKNGVATVQTSIGNLTGNVTSISGNVATIKTSLGVLKADINGVSGNVNNIINYGLIYEIVIIALIVVTLGIAVAGLLSTRDLKRRFGMKKE